MTRGFKGYQGEADFMLQIVDDGPAYLKWLAESVE